MSLTPEELAVAKQISEAAILQFMQHIKLDYQPDATVDPLSDGAVSGKAVYNFVKGSKGYSTYHLDISDDNADTGKWITLNAADPYIKQGLDGFEYLRLKFTPDSRGSVINGMPPIFQNIIYDMKCIHTTATMQEYVSAPPTANSTALMWIFMNSDDNRIAYLHRWVDFVKFEGDSYLYLWLSPLKRSYIGANNVTVNVEPTAAQKERCIIKDIYFYTF